MTKKTPPKLYSTAEAADYLGMHPQTLRYHVYDKGHIEADFEISGNLVFTQATLDEFKRKHQTADGMTMAEAAAYLGVAFTWMRYHVYNSKKIQPDGRRGNAWVFKQETLDQARRDLLHNE